MIDHTEHVKSVVRDELAKACTARGIDKRQAGFAIGGFGAMGMIIVQGEPQLQAHWSLAISLPPLLLGLNKKDAASIPVPGVLPPDETFRQAVNYLLAEVDKKRHEEFQGPVQGPSMNLSERPGR